MHCYPQLEGIEEAVELALLSGTQLIVLLDDAFGLAIMAGDCVFQTKREPVMHEAVTGSESPQRRRSDLARGRGEVCGRQDGYAVTAADVMQQEVTIGVNGFIAERVGNGECAAIDLGALRSGSNRRRVANCAADL